jgi:hypothetical protein
MKYVLLFIFSVTMLFFIEGCGKINNSHFTITNYDLHVELSPDFDSLKIEAGISLHNNHMFNDTLKILLGKDFSNVEIKNINVLDNHQSPIEFTIDDKLISIPSSHLKIKHDTLKLWISYLMDTATGYSKDQYGGFAFMRNRLSTHVNAAITRTDNWFPKLAGQMNQKLPPFELYFEIPESHEMMASGKLIEIVERGNSKTFHWKNYDSVIDRSLYFFISPYERFEKQYADGFKLHMLLPQDTLKGNVSYLADVIHKSYKFFEKEFGSIGINEYKLSPFVYGYSGLCNSMTIPEKLFTKPVENNFLQYPVRNIIHECSHSWWGNAVTGSAQDDYWLFEGFAKYSEIIAIKSVTGNDVEEMSFSRMNQVAKAYADYAPSIKDAGKTEERQYQAVSAYYQGALLLKVMENYLGPELFRKVIKSYLKDNLNQWVTSVDFLCSVKKNGGSRIASLIETNISNKGFASYEIRKTRIVPMGAENLINYSFSNKGKKDLFASLHTRNTKPDTNFKMFIPAGLSNSIKVPVERMCDSAEVVLNEQQNYLLKRFGFVGAGGIAYRYGDGMVRLTRIVDNTPIANAGIENMTVLVAIDDESTDNKDFFQLNDMLMKPQDSNCSYTVLINNEIKGVLVRY